MAAPKASTKGAGFCCTAVPAPSLEGFTGGADLAVDGGTALASDGGEAFAAGGNDAAVIAIEDLGSSVVAVLRVG